jgi:predicted nucleic acid-binding protein
MEDAFLLAVEKKLTAYDACYAVLAQRLNISLITVDEQLAQAIESTIFLGDFDLPRFEEE